MIRVLYLSSIFSAFFLMRLTIRYRGEFDIPKIPSSISLCACRPIEPVEPRVMVKYMRYSRRRWTKCQGRRYRVERTEGERSRSVGFPPGLWFRKWDENGEKERERKRERKWRGKKKKKKCEKDHRDLMGAEWLVGDDEENKVGSRAGGRRTGIKFRSGSTTRALARFIAGFTPRSSMQRRTTNLCHITECKDGRSKLGQRATERGMDVWSLKRHFH